MVPGMSDAKISESVSSWIRLRGSIVGTVIRWLWPGLIAGVAFLGVAMVGGSLTTTAWAMPDAIAAAVGVGAHGYGFQPVPALVGVTVHLATSMALGVMYTAIARRLRLRGLRLVVGAVLFIGLETPISIWVVLHSVLPSSTFHFFLGAIPFWASITGRNLYGLVLGLAPLLVRPVNAEHRGT
jgi:hypothetical protein